MAVHVTAFGAERVRLHEGVVPARVPDSDTTRPQQVKCSMGPTLFDSTNVPTLMCTPLFFCFARSIKTQRRRVLLRYKHGRRIPYSCVAQIPYSFILLQCLLILYVDWGGVYLS